MTMEKVHPNKAYLEHVAFKVKDIHWHIRFFREVLGMTLRDVDGDGVAETRGLSKVPGD